MYLIYALPIKSHQVSVRFVFYDFFFPVQFQALRNPECQEDCALCANAISPCQTCFEGNASGAICESPEKFIFWDVLHFTTDFHQILAEAIRQCTKDEPNYERDWVDLLCPMEA